MKFIQEFAASRTDMADIAAALSAKDRPPPKDDSSAVSPDVPSSVGEPAAKEDGDGSAEEAAAPLTREGAMDALADRCKQALGFSNAQVCMLSQPHSPCLMNIYTTLPNNQYIGFPCYTSITERRCLPQPAEIVLFPASRQPAEFVLGAPPSACCKQCNVLAKHGKPTVG